jgi:hypothetical protein
MVTVGASLPLVIVVDAFRIRVERVWVVRRRLSAVVGSHGRICLPPSSTVAVRLQRRFLVVRAMRCSGRSIAWWFGGGECLPRGRTRRTSAYHCRCSRKLSVRESY